MFNLMHMIEFALDDQDEERLGTLSQELGEIVAEVPHMQSYLYRPVMAGAYNGGHTVWRTEFADEAAYRRAIASPFWAQHVAPFLIDATRVRRDEFAAYPSGRKGGTTCNEGVYRCGFVCANINATAGRLSNFVSDLQLIATKVPVIQRWHVGVAIDGGGTRPWNIVMEQEYIRLQDVKGPYMMHPVHWSFIESWFDPEYPQAIADQYLTHTYCHFTSPIIS